MAIKKWTAYEVEQKALAGTNFFREADVLGGIIAHRYGWIDGVPDISPPYKASGKVKHRAWFSPEEYKVFYESGQLKAVGNYDNNMMNGKWVYYDEKGNVQVQLSYINGKAADAKKLTADEQKFFEMIEQNKGKFSDPTPADVLPGERRNNY